MEFQRIIEYLLKFPKENEFLEFKENNDNPKRIGETISALSNGAALKGEPFGYLIFGIENETKKIVGTKIRLSNKKIGNEEFENWLSSMLSPRINIEIIEGYYKDSFLSIVKIQAAFDGPVRFQSLSYVKVGSITRQLNDFREKEKRIWQICQAKQFETEIAMEGLTAKDVLSYLDFQKFFKLVNLPLTLDVDKIIDKFCKEKLIVRSKSLFSITNLGAILFASDIIEFENLKRKTIRVVLYDGKDKIKAIIEQVGSYGYAVGFEGLINFINDKLPANEEIGKALRYNVKMYPEIAVRELVANAIIHQDFSIKGAGPLIEIFSDRIEITNPGNPVISTQRFIDEVQSRNEKLAQMMRRMGICEERGSGIDKVISEVELYQLPAPLFLTLENSTKVILFAHRKLNQMDKSSKINACYQHCCLKYVMQDKMTNQTLRKRFNIEDSNYPMASRIINDTINAGLIKPEDPDNTSKKFASYIPFWA